MLTDSGLVALNYVLDSCCRNPGLNIEIGEKFYISSVATDELGSVDTGLKANTACGTVSCCISHPCFVVKCHMRQCNVLAFYFCMFIFQVY